MPSDFPEYCFTSPRLGFRNWTVADIPKMSAISGDPKVMEFFPAVATPEQTENFILRMQVMYEVKGYCYFAVDRLDTHEFIGFIGLCAQENALEFSPYVDIGWRLSPKAWGNGFATEGAKACLDYGFNEIGLAKILATAAHQNTKSIRVMQKIGMVEKMSFEHPALPVESGLNPCVCYTKSRIS